MSKEELHVGMTGDQEKMDKNRHSHNLILSNVQKAQNWLNPNDNCNVP